MALASASSSSCLSSRFRFFGAFCIHISILFLSRLFHYSVCLLLLHPPAAAATPPSFSHPGFNFSHFLSSHPLPHVARRVVPTHTRTHARACRLIGTASPSQSQSTSVASRRLLLSLIGSLPLSFSSRGPCTHHQLALAILPHFPPCRLPFSLKMELSRKDSLLPICRRSPPLYRLLPLPCPALSPLSSVFNRVCCSGGFCLLYRSKGCCLLPPLHFSSSFTFSNLFSSIAHTIHRRLVPPVPELAPQNTLPPPPARSEAESRQTRG